MSKVLISAFRKLQLLMKVIIKQKLLCILMKMPEREIKLS